MRTLDAVELKAKEGNAFFYYSQYSIDRRRTLRLDRQSLHMLAYTVLLSNFRRIGSSGLFELDAIVRKRRGK